MKFEVIFDNSNVVFAYKPSGVLTVPLRFDTNEEIVLGKALEAQLGIRLWPVHRLDYEAEGIILFAKTAQAHRALSIEFENQRVDKCYLAVTSIGDIADPVLKLPAVWTDLIVRGKKRSFSADHGKKATTTILSMTESIKKTPSPLLLWELAPITGRPHQLRYQLASRGFPILGDSRYGSKLESLGANGIISQEGKKIDLINIGIRFQDETLAEKLAIPIQGVWVSPPNYIIDSFSLKSPISRSRSSR